MSSPTRLLSVLALAVALLQGCGSSNPYQGLTASELFQRAQTAYDAEDYDEAIRALDRLFLSFAGFDEAEEARMMLADAHFQKEDYILARSEYNRFLSRFPTSAQAPVAALGTCQALAQLSPIPQRDQEYTREAMDTSGNVAVDYQGSEQAAVAGRLAEEMRGKLAQKVFLNGEFYQRRELWDSAIQYYEILLQSYPDTEYAPRALKGIIDANLAVGYDDLADEARERLLQDYPDSPAAQEVRANGDSADGDAVG